jgi:hypothetical protein
VSAPEKDPFHLQDEPDEPDEPDEKGASEPPPPPPPKPDRDVEGGNGFHVVPLPETVPARVPETAKPPAPPSTRPVTRRPARSPDEEEGVDTRTVAERRGEAVEIVAGRRPPPEGWPAEAFTFPLRPPGPATIAGAAVLLTLLDLASRANFFLGLLLKVLAAFFFLRWQLHVASRTAAGRDEPAGWAAAMDMSREQIRSVGMLLVAALVFSIPGILADVLERPGLAIGLFVLGGLWLAAGALGRTVGDPSLIRPWHALAWIVRRPLGMLVATAGWWAAGWTEILVWWMRDTSTGLYLAACLGLRLVGMYLWLLSARALGVVGRSWSLFDDDDDEPEDATSPAG